MSDYHIPVLLSQCIESLKIRPDGVYVDATFGAGGHSKTILGNMNAKGHLYAFDMDDDAWENAPDASNFTLIQSNYKFIKKFMRLYGVNQVDGILADLGISSHQIDVPERGFSFRFDAPLDMRMNQSNPLDAKLIINDYDEAELVKLLSEYGEVRNSKTLAKAIVDQRRIRSIVTTGQLNQLLELNAMGPMQKYFAQVYQALRIEVNGEIRGLEQFLTDAAQLLKPGGRFVVMSYHSLEDRLVKNLFKTGFTSGELQKDDFGSIHKTFDVITKKPIIPDFREQKVNPRSRSAKLRVAEKI